VPASAGVSQARADKLLEDGDARARRSGAIKDAIEESQRGRREAELLN
jgi:hypothetical protein